MGDYYSYNKAKHNLNDISEKIGQIRLDYETKIDNKIRDEINIIPKKTNIEFNNNKIEAPSRFYIINKDIFELLEKENFFYNMNDELKNIIKYKILLGNNTIVIKKKLFSLSIILLFNGKI